MEANRRPRSRLDRRPDSLQEPDKKEWEEEEEEKGYRSTSKYLYELVQEARTYRQQGDLAHHQSEEQIAELKSRIKELEKQLEREQKKESGTTKIDDIDFLEQFLSTEYQMLPEILQDIIVRFGGENHPVDKLLLIRWDINHFRIFFRDMFLSEL